MLPDRHADLYADLGSLLRVQVARDVPRRNTHRSQAAERQVDHVLAHAGTRFAHLACERSWPSGLRGGLGGTRRQVGGRLDRRRHPDHLHVPVEQLGLAQRLPRQSRRGRCAAADVDRRRRGDGELAVQVVHLEHRALRAPVVGVGICPRRRGDVEPRVQDVLLGGSGRRSATCFRIAILAAAGSPMGCA